MGLSSSTKLPAGSFFKKNNSNSKIYKKNQSLTNFLFYIYKVTPVTKCRLRKIKLDRINDYLKIEKEFIEK
jgi:hypothetical protein